MSNPIASELINMYSLGEAPSLAAAPHSTSNTYTPIRLSQAEFQARRAHIIAHGLPVRLHFPCPTDADPGWTFYKVECVPQSTPPGSQAQFLHLCTPQSVLAAPYQYHLSLCSGREMGENWGGEELEGEWAGLKALAQSVHGVSTVLRVSDVRPNYVAYVAWSDPVLGEHGDRIRRFRDLGELHRCAPMTISM